MVGGGVVSETRSFFIRYDGSGWTETDGLDIGTVTSVAGASADDFWVCSAFAPNAGIVGHFDGADWTTVTLPVLAEALSVAVSRLTGDESCGFWARGVAYTGPDTAGPYVAKLSPGALLATESGLMVR